MKLGGFIVLGSMIASVVIAACSSNSAPESFGSGTSTPKGSAGGFSAGLVADLKDGSGSNTAPPPPPPAGSATSGSAGSASATMAGSASAKGSGAGSATAMTGSASTKGSGAGSATAMTGSGAGSGKGSAAPPSAGKGSGSAVAMTGSGAGSAAKPGNNNGGNQLVVTPPTGKGSGAPVGPTRPTDNRHHVNPPADLAAIKIDLEPNWDRDFDEAGTVSFVLKVPNTNDTRVFSFHYGYDAAGAPADRDAYKKFLADQKLLTVTLDRQRGAAWYLEGTDGTGAPAFRYLVLFGGKRLVCGGVLYKDKDSTALGPDLRDKVVAAAKKICETLQL